MDMGAQFNGTFKSSIFFKETKNFLKNYFRYKTIG